MARPKGIPFSEEYSSENYAEFAVAKKPDGKLKMQKTLLILGYATYAILYCTIFLIVVQMPALIAMLPLTLFIIYLCTWRFTNLEFIYIVYQGMFHIYQNNGFNKAKEVFVAHVSENLGIVPLDDEYAEVFSDCIHTLDLSAGKGTSDRYVAVFEKEGQKTAVYFTAATKLLRSLRYYGGEGVVLTYVSR